MTFFFVGKRSGSLPGGGDGWDLSWSAVAGGPLPGRPREVDEVAGRALGALFEAFAAGCGIHRVASWGYLCVWRPGGRDQAVRIVVADRGGAPWFRYGEDGGWLAPIAELRAAAEAVAVLALGAGSD